MTENCGWRATGVPLVCQENSSQIWVQLRRTQPYKPSAPFPPPFPHLFSQEAMVCIIFIAVFSLLLASNTLAAPASPSVTRCAELDLGPCNDYRAETLGALIGDVSGGEPLTPRMTNAERLAHGLPPNPPVRRVKGCEYMVKLVFVLRSFHRSHYSILALAGPTARSARNSGSSMAFSS
jgi:hypothetical protein